MRTWDIVHKDTDSYIIIKIGRYTMSVRCGHSAHSEYSDIHPDNKYELMIRADSEEAFNINRVVRGVLAQALDKRTRELLAPYRANEGSTVWGWVPGNVILAVADSLLLFSLGDLDKLRPMLIRE